MPERSNSKSLAQLFESWRVLALRLGESCYGGALLALAVIPITPNLSAQADDDFSSLASGYLNQHCVSCHGDDEPEAGLSLTSIDGNIPTGKHIEDWVRIAEQLAIGDMPPEDEPRPDAAVTARVVRWIKVELVKGGVDVSDIGQKLVLPGHGNRVDHATLFSGKITDSPSSPQRLWRLRPQIYVSFVPRISRDARVGQPFSSHAGAGFKDYSDLFVVDEPTINQLMRNAKVLVGIQCGDARAKPVKEFAALFAAFGTQFVEPQKGDKASKRTKKRIEPADEEGQLAAVKAAIRKQFQLALLREPTDDEYDRFAGLMRRNVADAGEAIGVKSTLAAILMLPEAMYRFELGNGEADNDGRAMLSPRELAYSLALALTDSAPDGKLLTAAKTGKLATCEDVAREVERMLNDPKLKKPRIMKFFEEYFEYPAAIDVFKDLPRGKWQPEVLVNDTRLLIEYVLEQDRDVLKQLLTTNRSFVNVRVDFKTKKLAEARQLKPKKPKKDKKTGKLIPVPPRDPNKEIAIHDFYSLPLNWKWTDKQPIEFPRDERAGVLTQPSWLAAFASNNENHAIQRGKWIRERLLGGVIPDLPISVDAKLPDAPDQPLRQRMEITKDTYCWRCHSKMNPIGLMFEHYDFLGRYRKDEPVVDLEATAKNVDSKGKSQGTIMKGIAVEAAGKVDRSGDVKIDGEYRDIIPLLHKLADSPHVRQVFVRHAFRFWMGRNETLSDSATLIAADKAYIESGGSMKALITSLLTSDSFLLRQSVNSTSTRVSSR